MRQIEVIPDEVPPETINLVIHQCSDRRVRQYCANTDFPACVLQPAAIFIGTNIKFSRLTGDYLPAKFEYII
jgi:hypothetical protein